VIADAIFSKLVRLWCV